MCCFEAPPPPPPKIVWTDSSTLRPVSLYNFCGMDFQKLPTIGHSQKKCSKYSIVSEQNVQLWLSLTLILLRMIFVGYILCEMFHGNTLSLVSFVVFHAVCHTSSSKINPNSFCQTLCAIGTVLCLCLH